MAEITTAIKVGHCTMPFRRGREVKDVPVTFWHCYICGESSPFYQNTVPGRRAFAGSLRKHERKHGLEEAAG